MISYGLVDYQANVSENLKKLEGQFNTDSTKVTRLQSNQQFTRLAL